MDPASTNEKIKSIREINTRELNLTKSFGGGYNRKEVEDYVQNLKKDMEQIQKALIEKLEEYAAEVSMVSREREELKKNQTEIENSLLRLRGQEQEAAQEIARLQEENSNLYLIKQKQEELEINLDLLNAQNQEKAQRLEQFAKENNDLHELLQTANNELEILNNSVTKQEVSRLVIQNAELKEANTQLIIDCNTHLNTIKTLNAEMLEVKTDRSKKEDAINELKIANRGQEEENTTLGHTIEGLNVELTELKRDISMKDDAIKELIIAKRTLTMETNMKLYNFKINFEANIKHARKSMEDLEKVLDLFQSGSDAMYDKARIVPD